VGNEQEKVGELEQVEMARVSDYKVLAGIFVLQGNGNNVKVGI
jgi:hypothetical protein